MTTTSSTSPPPVPTPGPGGASGAAGGIRTRVWEHGRVREENYPLSRVSDQLADQDSLVWVDLADPDHATFAALAEELELDPNAVEDALGHDERPKATDYGRYVFVTAYATTLGGDDGTDLRTQRVSAFVLDRALVTVHSPRWSGIDEVVRRWDVAQQLVVDNGVDALLHGLLDTVVDGQFDTIQALDDAVDDLEDGLFEEQPQSRDQQRRAFELRRAVVGFRRVASPMTQLIATLHRVRGGRHPAMNSYWADLDDHIARVVEWTDSARDLLNNVFNANMSLQDARLNLVMKKLTAWAAIIAVPTAITGFYGQNVPYPGFSTHWGFISSSVLCVVAMAALYVGFRKRDWL